MYPPKARGEWRMVSLVYFERRSLCEEIEMKEEEKIERAREQFERIAENGPSPSGLEFVDGHAPYHRVGLKYECFNFNIQDLAGFVGSKWDIHIFPSDEPLEIEIQAHIDKKDLYVNENESKEERNHSRGC